MYCLDTNYCGVAIIAKQTSHTPKLHSKLSKQCIVFDSNFNFSNHVSQVIKSTRVHVRDLYRIRPHLDLNTSVLLANALVSSRLDYCNSLFLSLTNFELRRLQLVQNSLCRVVTRSSKFSHITPQLKKLHWLPVRYRDNLKLVLLHTKFSTKVNQFI